MKKLLYILCAAMVVTAAKSQVTTIVMNGTIHTGTGTVIEKGVLVTENGKIREVGQELKNLYKNATLIDASGKHVYPGLIALNSLMGLNEIDAIRATRDFNETGEFNPNVRALVAFNTDSKILPTASFNGILYTQAVPVGGVISGSSSVMKIQAWNWEDAAVSVDEGIHLNWPDMHPRRSDENSRNKIEKQIREIESFFAESYQYYQTEKPIFNARHDAMKGLFTGSKTLYIHTNQAKGIISSVQFFSFNFPGIRIVLVGAHDAYQLTSFLKEKNVAVVLSNLHELPARNDEDVDQPYKTPAALVKAGIKVALAKEGSWESRNLMFVAGTAVEYGLSKEDALKCITLNAAEISGMGKTAGSLEVGKDASFLISNGDLLDMKSSIISRAFVCGEEINLENDQKKLADKYKRKYRLN